MEPTQKPKPLTPHMARLVIDNPGAGWATGTIEEARAVLRQGGPLTSDHLDPAETAERARDRPELAARMAQHFEAMAEAEDRRARSKWVKAACAIAAGLAWLGFCFAIAVGLVWFAVHIHQRGVE